MTSNDDTTELFLNEAAKGWQRYHTVFERCSIEEQNRHLDAEGNVDSFNTSHVHWLGPDRAICFATLDDGTQWINCRRDDYAFWVGRNDKAEPWRLNALMKTADLQASDYTSRALRRSFYPDFLFRQDSLLDAIEKPYFQLLSVEHDPTDNFSKLYKIVFDYEHPYQRTGGDCHYNWVQKGTLWLDADNCWVIVRSQFELLLNHGKREWREMKFEFDRQSYRDVHLPVRCYHYDLNADWQREFNELQYVQEFRRMDVDELDLQTMKLTHYGFGEPNFRPSKPTVEIHVEAHPEIQTDQQTTVPFTVRNTGDDEVDIIRVAAC